MSSVDKEQLDDVMREFRQLAKNVSKNQADMNKVVYLMKGEMNGRLDSIGRDMERLSEAIYGNGQPGILAKMNTKLDESAFEIEKERLWGTVRKLSTFKTRILTIWATVVMIVVILWALSERYMRVMEVEKAMHSSQISQ